MKTRIIFATILCGAIGLGNGIYFAAAVAADTHLAEEHTIARHPPGSAIDRRIILERKTRENPFVLTPHRPTYILPATYTTSANQEPFKEFGQKVEKWEIKGQISVKMQLLREIFADNGFLYIAYTQKAHWQAYNTADSAPFRDTNHEPELFLTFLTNYNVLGMKNRLLSFGINHQSNGRSGTLSRSWNRLFAEFVLERGDFYLSVKPWWRIPEREKTGPDDTRGDDNPDLNDYMGYGEITGLYELGEHRLGFMARNNLKSDNRGALRLDWSFPIHKKMRGYAQYFNGYGETLIDYNHNSNRFGLGFMIIDWL